MLDTFQAMIDGKFAPLIITDNADIDMDSMITTFNTALTETAGGDPWQTSSEKEGKKNPWVAAEILDLCDKRGELTNKRLKPEES